MKTKATVNCVQGVEKNNQLDSVITNVAIKEKIITPIVIRVALRSPQ